MNKKEMAQRLLELEDTVSVMEKHLYDAVSNDIDRLHEQVNIWGTPTLKDRVEALEEKLLGAVEPTHKELLNAFVNIVNDHVLNDTLTEAKLDDLINSYYFFRKENKDG